MDVAVVAVMFSENADVMVFRLKFRLTVISTTKQHSVTNRFNNATIQL